MNAASFVQAVAHDRDQLELQCSHPLLTVDHAGHAELGLFFFFPRNVKLSAANYTTTEFYGDMTTLLRLDLPDMALADLAGSSPRSPLADLEGILRRFAEGATSAEPLRIAIKLFGHVFTEAVHDAADGLDARFHDEAEWKTPEKRLVLLRDVAEFCEDAEEALASLRRALSRCIPLRRAAPLALSVLEQTDEYCSLHFDAALSVLASSVSSLDRLRDGSGDLARVLEHLGRAARRELRHRRERGYLSWPGEESPEYFSFRRSILKRSVQQALYLDTRRVQSDKFVRNATGLVAAGLAATWAVVAQLPAQIRDLPPTLQTMLLGLPIIAYMAKDRIKELTREWLTARLRSFDSVNALRAESLRESGLGTLEGHVKEKTRFCRVGDVDSEIVSARAASRTVQGSGLEDEQILHYTRRLEWNDVPGSKQLSEGLAVRQIVRWNLRELLGRLDEPRHDVPHYDGAEGRFKRSDVPKVYHLNVVARLESAGSKPLLHRTRVVLNKEGILRLE